jgi:hypothetical protein
VASGRIKIRIKGAEVLDAKLRRMPAAFESGSREAVREEVHETAEDLRREAPVLSGNLRDTIREQVAKKGLTGSARITAKYAEFVIHGTSKQEANDFVTPVSLAAERRFPDRLRAAVRAQIKRL